MAALAYEAPPAIRNGGGGDGQKGPTMGQGDFTGYEFRADLSSPIIRPTRPPKVRMEKLKFHFVTDGVEKRRCPGSAPPRRKWTKMSPWWAARS